MKKRVWILTVALAAAAGIAIGAGVFWAISPHPVFTDSSSIGSDAYSRLVVSEASREDGSSPWLQEGQYALTVQTDIHTTAVLKSMTRQDELNFSYDLVEDGSYDQSLSEEWRLSVTETGDQPDQYRLVLSMVEQSFSQESPDENGPSTVVIQPAQSEDLVFLVDPQSGLTPEEDPNLFNTGESLLLSHILTGVLHGDEGSQQWEASFPFSGSSIRAWDVPAQYSTQIQDGQSYINISYSDEMDTQLINEMFETRSAEWYLPDSFFYSVNDLVLDSCSEANLRDNATGSMTVEEENPLLSSTSLSFNREGYLIVPRYSRQVRDAGEEDSQRVDLSTEITYSIVTQLETRMDSSEQE